MVQENLLEEVENESEWKELFYQEKMIEKIIYIQIMCTIFVLTCGDILS